MSDGDDSDTVKGLIGRSVQRIGAVLGVSRADDTDPQKTCSAYEKCNGIQICCLKRSHLL